MTSALVMGDRGLEVRRFATPKIARAAQAPIESDGIAPQISPGFSRRVVATSLLSRNDLAGTSGSFGETRAAAPGVLQPAASENLSGGPVATYLLVSMDDLTIWARLNRTKDWASEANAFLARRYSSCRWMPEELRWQMVCASTGSIKPFVVDRPSAEVIEFHEYLVREVVRGMGVRR